MYFIEKLILGNFQLDLLAAEDEKFALMFYYDIWQKGIGQFNFKNIYQGIAELAKYPEFIGELKEITDFLKSTLKHSTREIQLNFLNIMELHARYSRDQILCAMGKSTAERPFPSQEVANVFNVSVDEIISKDLRNHEPASPSRAPGNANQR